MTDFNLDEIFPYINPQMLYVRHLGFKGRFSEALESGDAMAVELRMWRQADHVRLTRLIDAVGLPTRASGVSRAAVRRALRYDKKFIRGRPRWVLPTRLGHVVVTEGVPPRLVERVLKHYLA